MSVEHFDLEGLLQLLCTRCVCFNDDVIIPLPSDARGVQLDPEDYTVHDVTGTLKQFFRSLPDPLMTHQFYSAFIAAVRKYSYDIIGEQNIHFYCIML